MYLAASIYLLQTYHSTSGKNGKSEDFKELRNGQAPLLCRISTA